MKMKDVCAQTGLTDRAVRLYIDQKLVNPEVSENHWGRRALEFRPEDVRRLADIAVLRKFGFSIAQIRAILEDPKAGQSVLENAVLEKQEQVLQQQKTLSALTGIKAGNIRDLPSLADALRDSANGNSIPSDGEPQPGYLKLFAHILLICAGLICGIAALILLTDMTVFYITNHALPLTAAGVHELFSRSGQVVMYLLVGLCLAVSLGYRLMIFFKYGFRSKQPQVRVRAMVVDKKQTADAAVLSSFHSRNSGMIEMLVFKTGDGSVLPLTVPRHIFYQTPIGTAGELVYQGSKMLRFTADPQQ